MQTRLLRSLSLALLIVFASVIAGCGDANVDVKETVTSTTPVDGEKEGCCGGCCEEDKSAVATTVAVKKECCGNCAKEEKVAAKECCGKCEKEASAAQLVATKSEACEYCKDGNKSEACEVCKKQKSATVSTKTEK